MGRTISIQVVLVAAALAFPGCGRPGATHTPPLSRTIRPASDPVTAPPPPFGERLHANRISLDLRQIPLQQACGVLSRVGGIPVFVEESPGLATEDPVSLCVAGVSPAAALDWICRQVDAYYVVQGDSVWISRGLPRRAREAMEIRGYSLEFFLGSAGGDSGQIRQETIQDPLRRQQQETQAPSAERDREKIQERQKRAVEDFRRLADEVLADLMEETPGALLTERRGRLMATLPARGHDRLRALVDIFEGKGGEIPAPPDPRIAAVQEVSLDLETPDFEGAVRKLSRASGVSIGYDARQVLLWHPRPIKIHAKRAALPGVLADFLAQAGWKEQRPEPDHGIWLSSAALDAAFPVSREHPWDRSGTRAFPVSAGLLSRRAPARLVEEVRAWLSPFPTRGCGRYLGVHVPTRTLVAVQEPEAMARIPKILEALENGRTPEN